MKLCMECAWYGGMKASNGRYICNNILNDFPHPVDGMKHKYDASYLRMAPELQVIGCGMDAKWWRAKDAVAEDKP